jgi:putative FmdB family regulatory protein
MPTYEYACTSCGERTERKQGFNDPPLEECPLCGGKLRKLYSPVGIVFKGSGFYSTDARKKAASASSGDGKAPKKESAGKDSAGKEPATGGRSKSGADKSA